MPKKSERGDPLGFFNIILSQTAKKIEGGTLWEIFSEKKSRSAKKNWKGVSPGMVCYAGKQEKPFWFSSLGQMVQ